MADTKTYIKVPYQDTFLRMTPFNGGHLTALTMAQQLRSDARKVNVILRILHGMLGEDAYEAVTNDLVDGVTKTSDLFDLLNASIQATAAYEKAKAQAGSGAEDNGLDSDHGRE